MNAPTPTLVIRHATPDTGDPPFDARLFEPAFLDVEPGRLRPPVLPGCGPRELAHLGHRICRTPRDLATHTRRVLLAHALRDPDETFAALADLFAALGDVGVALRRTLVQRTGGILSPDQRRALDAMLTRAPTVDEMMAVPRTRLPSPVPPAAVVRRIARAVASPETSIRSSKRTRTSSTDRSTRPARCSSRRSPNSPTRSRSIARCSTSIATRATPMRSPRCTAGMAMPTTNQRALAHGAARIDPPGRRRMTAGTTHDPLRVDLLGADQRLRDTLALVFRGPAQGVCLLVPRADAQAVVVNLDGAGAAAEWERYREAHPDRPAIVLSIGAAQIPGAAAVVQKPVRIDRLVEAVRVVRSVLGDRPGTPTGRPIEPPAPRVAARAEASLPPTIDRLPVHAPPVTHPPVEVAPTNVRESNENARTVATKAIAEITRTLATQVPPPRAPESPRTEAFAAPRTAASPAESLAMRSRARTAAQENPQWDALCGSAPDIHADDPSQVDGVRYKGDARFLRCVEQAVEDARLGRQIIAVRTQQRLLLVVSGTPSTIASCVSDDLLATLARQAHGTHDFDTIILSALPPASDTIQVLSTEALLWKLGLWTYRGDPVRDVPRRPHVPASLAELHAAAAHARRAAHRRAAHAASDAAHARRGGTEDSAAARVRVLRGGLDDRPDGRRPPRDRLPPRAGSTDPARTP
jgi:hypothetical protein